MRCTIHNYFDQCWLIMTRDQDKLDSLKNLVGSRINKYKLVKYINSGGYGDVFEVTTLKNKRFAIKLPNEKTGSEASIASEFKIYKELSDRDNGVINMIMSKYNGKNFIVMDLLGPSIAKFLKRYTTFNLQTTILLTIEMIKILQYIHSKGYIHRDVKNHNFTIDKIDPTKIFCIDFGMATRYTDDTGKHLPQERIKCFYGTEHYASLSSHMYITQSRRDDLESLIYNLVYMHTGNLPWLRLEETDKRKRIKMIYELKKNVDPKVLCKGMPREYCIFFKYIRNLRYSDKPHYNTLISMFTDLLIKNNFENQTFQWCKLK